MKFKTLFLLFNIIILTAFLFVFFMPLPVLGWDYALSFWAQNWGIAVLFALVLVGLDAYFVANWRLFGLLEREDWPGLSRFLEAELARKGTLGVQKTRIFLNACLIGQAPGRIDELRALYVERKVAFVPRVALSLGLPLVLDGRAAEIEAFFGPLADDKKTGADGPWIRWCLAFARLLQKDAVGARPLLERGLKDPKQPLLELLSLYLLENLRGLDPEVGPLVDERRRALADRLTPKEWQAHLDSLKERVLLVLFMDKLIGEARQWLTASGGASA